MAIKIRSWCKQPEEGALEQARNLASLPFIFKYVALMPDVHLGYGMPIGGVVCCKNVVSPAMVGVDIGCGMVAMKTGLQGLNTIELKYLLTDIRLSIPVGFNHHKQITNAKLPELPSGCPISAQEYEKAAFQLGTLGGGNHFIELQKDSDESIWVMIHSGSRNVGKKIADHYIKLAKSLNEQWFSSVPKEFDLAFLPANSAYGITYIKEMNFALEFALANRFAMLDAIGNVLRMRFSNVKFGAPINIHHNYARLENHFCHNVWVHRKGATSAKKDEIGIIPGSQGSASYIVRGLGNSDSFNSCSHGAGRKMGRKEAKRSLSLEDEAKSLNDRGIIHSVRNVADLDEAPGAYKDIDIVMEEQKDLVEIVTKLSPLAVIKG